MKSLKFVFSLKGPLEETRSLLVIFLSAIKSEYDAGLVGQLLLCVFWTATKSSQEVLAVIVSGPTPFIRLENNYCFSQE